MRGCSRGRKNRRSRFRTGSAASGWQDSALRHLLIGAGLAAIARGARASSPAVTTPRFDGERFVDDCRRANDSGGQAAVREVMARAMETPRAVLAGIGEPDKGGIRTLHRSAALAWSPLMQLMPHEHSMWSLIGIYTGREDNIFWERRDGQIRAVSASAISAGVVVPLARDVIHSVANPIEKLTGAIHIYGGDFFAVARSEWDPETLVERDWDIGRAVRIFQQANQRF